MQYTSFTVTREVNGLADRSYFFEGSWPTPTYARSAPVVVANGTVGWSNGQYSSQQAASNQTPV